MQGASAGTAVPVPKTMVKKTGGVKIGRPGYKVTKERDPKTKQNALLFEGFFLLLWLEKYLWLCTMVEVYLCNISQYKNLLCKFG